ncbi:MAG: hypothetical protein QM599_02360 [Pseudoxanthomonas sp.]
MNRFPKSASLLFVGLLAATLGGHCAAATQRQSTTHVQQLRIDDDSLSWRDDDHSLRLRDRDRGIVVESAQPEPMLGLRKGDTIVAVAGRAVADIRQLRDALQSLNGGSALLSVRDGNGKLRDVRLAGDDYRGWLPTPSSAPSPPAPPAR